ANQVGEEATDLVVAGCLIDSTGVMCSCTQHGRFDIGVWVGALQSGVAHHGTFDGACDGVIHIGSRFRFDASDLGHVYPEHPGQTGQHLVGVRCELSTLNL